MVRMRAGKEAKQGRKVHGEIWERGCWEAMGRDYMCDILDSSLLLDPLISDSLDK